MRHALNVEIESALFTTFIVTGLVPSKLSLALRIAAAVCGSSLQFTSLQ